MKLSMKLSLSMGILTLIIICTGLFGIYQMSALNTVSTNIANAWMPAIVDIEGMNTLVSDFRIAEVQHIFSTNEKEMQYYEKSMAGSLKLFNEHSDDYSQVNFEPEEKRLYESFKKMFATYMTTNKEIVKLSQQLKVTEATAILNGDSRDLYREMSATLLKLVEFNVNGGEKASLQGQKVYSDATTFLITLLVFSVIIAAIVATYIVRNTLAQLGKDPHELGAIAKSVASGNLDVRADAQAVGVYADILTMVDSLKLNIENARKESEHAKEESERAHKAMGAAELASKDAQSKRDSMLKAADRLESIANIVSSASTELSAQIEQSERGASEQAARVTETATAMEEMNSTVLEVARNAGTAADMSLRTRKQAEAGAQVVQRAVNSIQAVQNQSLELKKDMGTLGEHAQSISQIMGVISDIADQTNLLALNAAIEAARAGDAGRGFAVVADEVRKLAEKTMASTTDVGNAIRAIQQSATKNTEQVDSTVKTIEEATVLAVESGTALKEIVSMVDSTADQVRAIATASEQQSASSEEINRSIAQVNAIAGETARAMGEAARAVSDLAHQSQVLGGLIEEMKNS